MPKERRLFILALAAGSVLRALQLSTSIGSVDALLWTRWSELIAQVGVLRSYQFSEYMNHPPLALLIAHGAQLAGDWIGLEFHHGFRLVQCLADVVTAVALLRISSRMPRPEQSSSAALFFFLSPATIFISAFHCNSDPLMMMFLVLAVLCAVEGRPALAGVLLGLAVGIKIVPLLAGPLFLFAFRTKRTRLLFLGAAAVTAAVIFTPALIVNGPLFAQRVFGYSGMLRSWGLPLIALILSGKPPVEIPPLWFANWLLLAGLVLIWIGEFRSRSFDASRLPALTGLTFFVVLFLAPGFGPQYLFWLLPFAAFAVPRTHALLFHGATSIYLFMLYTARSGGWPWWFAQEIESESLREGLVKGGLLLWALVGVMASVAAWRLFRRVPAN